MSLSYDTIPKVLRVIDFIGQGYSVSHACDHVGVAVPTFETYTRDNPELQALLVDAERRCYDAMAEALLRPDNHALYGQTDAKMAKVVSDNIKWFLDKKDNKRFGNKMQVTHELKADSVIIEALDRAKNRSPSLGRNVAPMIEDATYTVVDEDAKIMNEILS